jgi:RNA polymerase sigma-70 factor (ECF subfamily)
MRIATSRIGAGNVVDLDELVPRYQGAMLRLAFTFLHSQSLAEDLVQDTWAAVIENLPSFQGRCSLKNWIFRILVNKAKNRRFREARFVPFSAMSDSDSDNTAANSSRLTVEGNSADRLENQKSERPEALLLRKETIRDLERALEELPPNQRAVVTLRDIEDLDAGEVCSTLRSAAGNQRVLLHRGRSKLRQALAEHLRAA